MNSKLLLTLAGVAVLAGSSIAFATAQDHGRPGGRAAGRQAQAGRDQAGQDRAEFRRGLLGARSGARDGQGLRARLEQRRALVAKRLGVTDAQREEFRAHAKVVAPAVEQARGEARAILERTRAAVQNGGDRAALREQARGELKALFQRTFPQLEPSARAIVEQLTPEQRAKLEAGAARRGKTLDEDRLERGAALFLMRRAKPEAHRDQR